MPIVTSIILLAIGLTTANFITISVSYFAGGYDTKQNEFIGWIMTLSAMVVAFSAYVIPFPDVFIGIALGIACLLSQVTIIILSN